MRIEDHGLVFDATTRPPDQRVCAFVSLCPLSDGTILCGFQNGPQKNSAESTVRLCRSRDYGKTWQELPAAFEREIAGIAGSLSSGEIVEAEPGRLLLFSTWFDRSDPERPLFDPETDGILHSRQLMAQSSDGGESWSAWREIPIPGLTGCASTGPVVRWDDGTIAFPFESYKEFDDPSPARHAAWVLVSRDAGKSFEEPQLVAQDTSHQTYYWDQRLCPSLNSGEYAAMFWTHNREQKADLAVHFRRGSLADSAVDAAAAQKRETGSVRDTGIPGQIAAPLLLDDGRILSFVVDRGTLGTMKLWQSSDHGNSWPTEDALLVYTHDERAPVSQGKTEIDYNEYWADMAKWSFGHPCIRPLPNQRVLVAYYAGTPDCMSVHWARIDTRYQSQR